MSATQHTTNLHLSQFQSTDIPTWMSDYNGDMMRIDNSIGNISDLVNPEGSLVENINAFQDDVDALETLIGSATDLPVPTDSVTKNISQINNNLSTYSKVKIFQRTVSGAANQTKTVTFTREEIVEAIGTSSFVAMPGSCFDMQWGTDSSCKWTRNSASNYVCTISILNGTGSNYAASLIVVY